MLQNTAEIITTFQRIGQYYNDDNNKLDIHIYQTIYHHSIIRYEIRIEGHQLISKCLMHILCTYWNVSVLFRIFVIL